MLTLTGFIVAYQFVDPSPPRHITIANGRSTGAYYEIAIDPFFFVQEVVVFSYNKTTGTRVLKIYHRT